MCERDFEGIHGMEFTNWFGCILHENWNFGLRWSGSYPDSNESLREN